MTTLAATKTYTKLSPSPDQVRELFKQGDLVPVYRLLPADLETPVSVFLKLFRPDSPTFLLESVEGGEQVSRYSFIGVNPNKVIKADGSSDVLTQIEAELKSYHPVVLPGLPRFVGGAVGYLSYDIVRQFERLPDNTLDDVQLPEALFMLFDSVVIFDHAKAHLIVLVNAHNQGDPSAAYQVAAERIEALVEQLRVPLPQPPQADRVLDAELVSTFEQAEFEAAVEKAKEYIRAGDAFQIVLSQRLS